MSFAEYPKLKKYIVFIPAVFFTFFGCSTLVEVYNEVVAGAHQETVTQSLIPLVVS